MRQFRLAIGVMAVAVSSLFLVQASAQQVNMTACITKGGDSKNWGFGLTPLKPCSSNESEVTFALKALTDAIGDEIGDRANNFANSRIDAGAAADTTNAGKISAIETEIGTPFTASRIDANQNEIGTPFTASRIDGHETAIALEVTNRMADVDAEEAARVAAVAAEANTRGAADTAEANTRAAADTAEANTRAAADTANANNITAIENEIEDKANNYANSRIDQNAAAASNVAPVVFATGAGGHEDTSNFYRGGTYNQGTGDFKMYFDTNHGLDKPSGAGYWFCTIGDQVAQGDLLVALQTKVDDYAEVALKGFTESSAHFAFKLKNVPGTNSPFKRVLVHPIGGGSYIEIFPNNNLTAWIFGLRSSHPDGVGLTGDVSVAVSHAELESVCGCTIHPDNNSVLVDLNFTLTNVLKFENDTNRGTHPSAANLIPPS